MEQRSAAAAVAAAKAAAAAQPGKTPGSDRVPSFEELQRELDVQEAGDEADDRARAAGSSEEEVQQVSRRPPGPPADWGCRGYPLPLAEMCSWCVATWHHLAQLQAAWRHTACRLRRDTRTLLLVLWQARDAAVAAVRQRHAEQAAAERQQPPEPDEPPPKPAADEL